MVLEVQQYSCSRFKDVLEVHEVQQLNETSNSAFAELALRYCTSCTFFSFVSKAVLEVHEVQQLTETPKVLC